NREAEKQPGPGRGRSRCKSREDAGPDHGAEPDKDGISRIQSSREPAGLSVRGLCHISSTLTTAGDGNPRPPGTIRSARQLTIPPTRKRRPPEPRQHEQTRGCEGKFPGHTKEPLQGR